MTTGRIVAALVAFAALGAPSLAHAQNTRAGLPPADQPAIREIPRPTSFSVEGGAGIVGFLGGVGALGPGWNVRVTGAINDRWAIEGNYLGSTNTRADTRTQLVMTSLDAGARYNLAAADRLPLQPFVVAGVGYAGFAGSYGDGFTLIVPVGVGADRMLTENIKVGARFNYRPAFFDNLGSPITPPNDEPGGDTWTLLAQIGGGF
ncbi:outer membrane beta-barrel protein [Polyangium jinanense]|uniref:Porin family protein n=1 Tax=Polyangium jinanense TaxID=2829994 RepID=A0A9X4AXN3_9BACT|nr:outer membrane beta-barrel protein [Polyangium jinanense]MDC3961227.1 porin family protein [Polyangium jinanense]MDC3988579.1 porin family protein [Polyangium jinanense]